MRLSPNLGLPIAEQDDFATNFPTEVDDPRTTALDSLIRPVHVTAGIVSPSQSFPSGVKTTVTEWVLNAMTGSDFVLSNGLFTCNVRGVYLVKAALTFDSGVPADVSRRLYLDVEGYSYYVAYLPGTGADVVDAVGMCFVGAGQAISCSVFQGEAGSVGLYPSGHSMMIAKVAEYA